MTLLETEVQFKERQDFMSLQYKEKLRTQNFSPESHADGFYQHGSYFDGFSLAKH